MSDHEMKVTALENAVRTCSGSLDGDSIVAVAKKYYDFLKNGTQKNSADRPLAAPLPDWTNN